MKRTGRNKGFTLVELLMVIAILALLAGALLTASKYVVTSAKEKLTESTISVIIAALEQYYDDNNDSFPFQANYVDSGGVFKEFLAFRTSGEDSLEETIENDLGLADADLAITATNKIEYASIETMYYFLDRSYNSSQIISAISDRFITNIDDSGNPLTLTWPIGPSTKTIPLIRIVDVWGNAFRYSYTAGASFPVIISAGKDGDFSTAGDNISSDDL